jgi:hypothetical protein
MRAGQEVQWVFEGLHMLSCEDANIAFGLRQALVHPTKVLIFYI